MANALAATGMYDDATQRARARHDALVMAAQAAVKWAHAQRSKRPPRTTSSIAPIESEIVEPPAAPVFSMAPLLDAARSAGDASLTAARGAQSVSRVVISTLTAVGGGLQRVALPVARALPRVAAVAAIGGGIWFAVVKGRPYVERWKATPPITRTVPPITEADLSPTESATGSKKRTGRLVVNSTGEAAQVTVDGKMRGVTPLTLDGLAAGRHTVVLQSAKGSIEQVVVVGANETAQLDSTIYPGWVAIVAPVDVTISEGARSLRPDDRNQVMLSPGGHDLLFENRALGYQEVRHVDVRPGETTQLSIAPPRSKASFTSTSPAEVWIDGKGVGQTPLFDLPIDIGTHHVRMKSGGQERQFTITATMTPLTFNADFSQ